MKQDILATLNKSLHGKDYNTLRTELLKLNEIDAAIFIDAQPKEQAVLLFRTLPQQMSIKTFPALNAETQIYILSTATDKEITEIFQNMFIDDILDCMKNFPNSLMNRIFLNLSANTTNLVKQFLSYKKNSACTLMSLEYMALHKSLTVGSALQKIRYTAMEKETIYTCYITDSQNHLEGVLSLKRLLLAKEDNHLDHLMEKNYIFATPFDTRESAATLLTTYHLLSLPVIDEDKTLLGIITIDDAVKVIQEEGQKEFFSISAISPPKKSYLKTGVFSQFARCILPLTFLLLLSMITCVILEHFRDVYSTLPLLVTFIPLLLNMGGTIGSQSATVVIRGLSLSEIKETDFVKVLGKELISGLFIAVVLGGLNYLRIYLSYPDKQMMGLAVTFSFLVTVILAKLLGVSLPMFAKLLRLDLSLISIPLQTAVISAISLIFYLTIAQGMLLT